MAKKKKKTRTEGPITADELLAMESEDLHQWVERKMAERIAYHERKLAEERSSGEASEST